MEIFRKTLFFALVFITYDPFLSGSAKAAEQKTEIARLQSLARKGLAQAQFQLADRYERGNGVAKNYPKALILYCQAARQGHSEAAYRLGLLHLFGQGVTLDKVMASAWFRMAATHGHDKSLRMLRQLGPRPGPTEPRCPIPKNPPVNAPRHIDALVRKMAPTYGLDPRLVLSIMSVESAFRSDAVSPRDARGLMQLSPATAERFGVKRLFDPAENIRGGMRYLRWLLAYFAGDVTLVLAAYNAGEGAVEKHGGVPPYRETRTYVEKVMTLYGKEQHPFQARIARASRLVGAAEVAELE